LLKRLSNSFRLVTMIAKFKIYSKTIPCVAYLIIVVAICQNNVLAQKSKTVKKDLDYCVQQVHKTLAVLPKNTPNIPRSIHSNSQQWRLIDYKDWTCGFWPGILWYAYEFSKDAALLNAATEFTQQLKPLAYTKAEDHDLGFQMFCSYGNGYRLTKNPAFKKILLATADTLITLYNPNVGTILSWPREVKTFGGYHNTIMDNMINLELLFWASKNSGNKKYYDIAIKHANTTMKNHFRNDYSGYHVVLYDSLTGKKIKGITHQGYSDSSMWARGQSWAIYGYTMCYKETGKKAYLDFAQKVTDVYLNKLPEDMIPFWDFNDPAIPNAPKDASAAAVTASALLDLSKFVTNPSKKKRYQFAALKMLASLSSEKYHANNVNTSFLLHSTGHKPNRSEIDASIIYADYYYIEALLKIYNKK